MTALVVALVSGILLLLGSAITVLGNVFLTDRKELRDRVENLERRERIRDDYIIQLRQHIEERRDPPPPPYPPGLTQHD